MGRFAFRHLQSVLFGGFERVGGIPVATPEKALFDSIYWAAARGRSPRSLPEIELPAGLSRTAVESWIRKIPSTRLQIAVTQRLGLLLPRVRRGRVEAT
jgi:hypothetical protein